MELNGIIINGVRYDYIIDHVHSDCDHCDLRNVCEDYDENGTLLEEFCLSVDQDGVFKESEI